MIVTRGPVNCVVNRETSLKLLKINTVSGKDRNEDTILSHSSISLSHDEQIFCTEHQGGAGEGGQPRPGLEEEGVEAGQLEVAAQSGQLGEALEEGAHHTVLEVSVPAVAVVQDADAHPLQPG